MVRPILLAALVGLFASCSPKSTKVPTQGLKGQLVWLEGNQMPSTERPALYEGSFVQRRVLIYELTHRDQCSRKDQLFTRINTERVARIISDSSGYFSTHLPPGTYSVFTEEDQGYFANKFDGQGYVNPVTITKGATTSISIKIDYKAFY